MRGAVLLGVVGAAGAQLFGGLVKIAIECDSEKRATYPNGTIEVPCEVVYKLPFGQEAKSDLVIQHAQCKKEFRVTGTLYGNAFDEVISEEDNEMTIPIKLLPKNCKTLYFNDITTSEDGIAFCPSFGESCPVHDPECQRVATSDKCVGNTDCGACLADDRCGWCYASQVCLPRGEAGQDRCGHCLDFATEKCEACVEGCGGRGTCEGHACTCDADWTGASCDIYAPGEDAACNTVYGTAELALSASVGDLYQDAFAVSGPHVVEYLVLSVADGSLAPPAGASVYVRYGNEVEVGAGDAGFDHKVPLAATAAPASERCLSFASLGGRAVLALATPPMGKGMEVWVGSEAPGVRLRATFVTCQAGFGGAACAVPVTAFDPNEEDGPGGFEKRRGDDGIDVHTLRVGLEQGGERLVRFPVAVDTVLLAASLKDGIGPAVEVDVEVYYDGRAVQGVDEAAVIHNPMPSPHWAVRLHWTRGTAGLAKDFELALRFQRCEVDYHHGCGRDAFVMPPPPAAAPWRQELTDIPWDASRWVRARVAVRRGVQQLKVTAAAADLPSLELYASYRIPAQRRESALEQTQLGHLQHFAHAGELAVPDPATGFWYISVYSEEHIFDGTKVSLAVEATHCRSCGGAECVEDASAPKVVVNECVGNGAAGFVCDRTGATYDQFRCVDATDAPPTSAPAPPAGRGTPMPAARGGSGPARPAISPPAPAPVPVSNQSSAGTGSGAKGLLLGVAAGMLGVGAFAAGMYFFSKWRVRQTDRRRRAGGYDPTPVPTGEEFDDFNVELGDSDEDAQDADAQY
eukprot:TRINITY_DN9017_c0_g1_i1.p1 TRINITY_DN9017_c0_g1~~TRINITY_DN9017_c0_g1_i1.p1  ORF type:complete len:802 (+),score=245.39 TRINITY_DN9017_c0_g1_i1:53-2458(+)